MIKGYLCNIVFTVTLNNSSVVRLVTVDMDFSNFNSAEQAHMTKVIEKRQVSTYLISYPQSTSQIYRCKTSSECIPTSSRNASTLAVMTSRARHCHQKRSFLFFSFLWDGVHSF